MSVITLLGISTPTAPNIRLAVFDNDAPAQFASFNVGTNPLAASVPIRVMAVVDSANKLRVQTDSLLRLDPGTITTSGMKWDATGAALEGSNRTLVLTILRFLRRLSKLNRGAN